MPRIPRIMVTEGVEPAKGAQIPFSAGANAYAGFAQAGQNIAEAAGIYAQLERRKKDLAVKQEAGFLDSEYERETAAGVAALQFERDPDEYARLHEQMLTDVERSVRDRAKNPEAGQAFEILARGTKTRRQAEAYKRGNVLFTERGVAQKDATVDTLVNLGGLATTDEEFQRHHAAAQRAIDQSVPLIGEKQARDEKSALTQRMLGAKAEREAHDNPDTFVESADTRFSDLEAKKRQDLKKAAAAQIETNRKSHNQEWEAYYTRIEEEADRERNTRLINLRDRANKRTLTIADIDNERAYGTFKTPNEYDALYDALTKPGPETPSDPTTLLFVQLRTRGHTPGITHGMLDSMKLSGKLNNSDWLEEKGKLDSLITRSEDKGKADKFRDFGQGVRLLQSALEITAERDKVDKQDEQLYSKLLDELTSRSYEGTEDSLTVARELMERVAPVRQARIKLKVQQYKESLPPILRSDKAAKSMKLLDDMRRSGGFSGPTLDVYRRTILEWGRMEVKEDADKVRPPQ